MKPLEPGCLAMIINSRIGNNGKVVTVGDFLGEVKTHVGTDFWEVSPGILTNRGRISHFGHESQLMRIDDFDGEYVLERVKKLEGVE